MADLTQEQRAAIERLQSQQADVSKEERRRFMSGIANVPRSEMPPKEKRPRAKKSSA